MIGQKSGGITSAPASSGSNCYEDMSVGKCEDNASRSAYLGSGSSQKPKTFNKDAFVQSACFGGAKHG